MSEIKVNSIKGVGASAAAITVNNTDGTCIANITNNLRNNLIINGDMKINQRGTADTRSGIYTVDRFKVTHTGIDEAPEQRSVNLGSSDTGPWEKGFRKALKITNGNQTGGAGASDYVYYRQEIEASNVANSGWDYSSSSSFITLSFWVKASVAQNYYGYLRTRDGTNYHYPFETGALTAGVWKKVIKTIPGNSNLQFDNDSGPGLQFNLLGLMGTDYTSSSVTLNTWGASGSGNVYTPDNTPTWYETDDSTLELTGVQLEVGNFASDFCFESYEETLSKCQRYFQKIDHRKSTGSSGNRYMYQEDIKLICSMRAAPSLYASSAYNSDSGNYVTYTAGDYSTTTNGCTLGQASTTQITVTGGSGSQYHDVRGRVHLAAEL